jgi:transposase
MLGLPPSVRIYFAAEPVDVRKGIDGLRAHVECTFRNDPYEGHLFRVRGQAARPGEDPVLGSQRVRADLKHLERGRFQLPVDAKRRHVQPRLRMTSCSTHAPTDRSSSA